MERLVILFSCVTLCMVNIYMCTLIFGNIFVATEVFCGSPDLPDGCTQKLLADIREMHMKANFLSDPVKA